MRFHWVSSDVTVFMNLSVRGCDRPVDTLNRFLESAVLPSYIERTPVPPSGEKEKSRSWFVFFRSLIFAALPV